MTRSATPLTRTLLVMLSLFVEAGFAQTATPARLPQQSARQVKPARVPAPILILEEKLDLGAQSANLSVQRLRGITNQPGYTFYFPGGERVTEDTAEALVFNLVSDGLFIEPREVQISLRDGSGKTLESLPQMMTSQHLLILVPASAAQKALTASVTVRNLPPHSLAIDVRRLVRQDKYFTDL